MPSGRSAEESVTIATPLPPGTHIVSQVSRLAEADVEFGDGKFTQRRWQQSQTEIALELQQFATQRLVFNVVPG